MKAYAYEIKRHDGAVIRGVCLAENLERLFWQVDRWCDPSGAVYWEIPNPSFSANWVVTEPNTDFEDDEVLEFSMDCWGIPKEAKFFSLTSGSYMRFKKIKAHYVPSVEQVVPTGGDA